MNAQEARNYLALEKLKRALRDGSITNDELKARILRVIKQEEQKGPARMDTALIASCENLLWQLHDPQTQAIRNAKREGYLRLREGMRKQNPAARRAGWARTGWAMAGAALAFGLFFITLPRPQPEVLSTAATNYGTPLPVRESVSPGDIIPTTAPTPSPTPEPTPKPSPAPTEILPAQTSEPSYIDALAAGDKYMNLKDMRAQAPARFQYTADVNGNAIRIDAPVIIPQGDTMPVPRLKWLPIDKDALRSAAAEIAGPGTALSIGGDEYGMDFSAYSMVGDRLYFEPTGNTRSDIIITDNSEPENNPFTSKQAYDMALKLLESLGVDPSQTKLYAQAGTSARYKVGSVDERAPDRYSHFYTDKPIEGREQGFHILVISQTLGGIPVFPNGYHWGGPNYNMDNRLRMRILNQKEFSAEGRLIRAEGVKARDLPLANIGRVFDTLRGLIEEGRLRQIDRIQLGYELFYEQHVKSGSGEAKATLLAVPVWQVLGRMYGSAFEGDRYYNMIARDQYETSLYRDPSFELRINAQTGEYIDPYSENNRTYNPAILTWEQMEGEDDVSLYN